MAQVKVAQVGAVTKQLEASTVAEALSAFGLEGIYHVDVNGKASNMDATLSGGEFISVGEKVKGGLE